MTGPRLDALRRLPVELRVLRRLPGRCSRQRAVDERGVPARSRIAVTSGIGAPGRTPDRRRRPLERVDERAELRQLDARAELRPAGWPRSRRRRRRAPPSRRPGRSAQRLPGRSAASSLPRRSSSSWPDDGGSRRPRRSSASARPARSRCSPRAYSVASASSGKLVHARPRRARCPRACRASSARSYASRSPASSASAVQPSTLAGRQVVLRDERAELGRVVGLRERDRPGRSSSTTTTSCSPRRARCRASWQLVRAACRRRGTGRAASRAALPLVGVEVAVDLAPRPSRSPARPRRAAPRRSRSRRRSRPRPRAGRARRGRRAGCASSFLCRLPAHQGLRRARRGRSPSSTAQTPSVIGSSTPSAARGRAGRARSSAPRRPGRSRAAASSGVGPARSARPRAGCGRTDAST